MHDKLVNFRVSFVVMMLCCLVNPLVGMGHTPGKSKESLAPGLISGTAGAQQTEEDELDTQLTQMHMESSDHVYKEEETDDGAAASSSTQKKFPLAYFSPGIATHLIQCIAQEKKQIRAALWRLTLMPVAYALCSQNTKLKTDAHEHPVQIVLDRNYEEDFCQALEVLNKGQVQLYRNGKKKRFDQGKAEYEIMHHKFIIFDKNLYGKKLLWTGSFNVTGQANTNSWENVIIIDDAAAIKEFECEYEKLVEHAQSLAGTVFKTTKQVGWYAAKINGIE